MLQIENTFFQLGESLDRNCLIICDRGAMDASACEFCFFIPLQATTVLSQYNAYLKLNQVSLVFCLVPLYSIFIQRI